VRVVAGFVVPALADRLDRRRHTVVVCAVASILLFLAHLRIGDEAVLLAATLAVGFTLAGIGPIAEALGVAASRFYDFDYARARGLGSLGFLGANVLVGVLIARTGSGIALWWIVFCLAGTAALAFGHPGGRRVQDQIPPDMREIGRLMLNPVFAIFMAAVAFTQASHGVYYAFGSIHWLALGLGEARLGALWAASVGTEIILMVAFGAWVTARLGPVRAMAVSGAAGILRWGAMMADPTGWVLWPLQALHALTFAVGHLGAVGFIAQAVPGRFGAAAQGATGAMAVGLVMALAMVAAAAVYPALGGRSYVIGAALSALGLALCYWLASRWGGEEIAV
jgi:PPP family 3-phenylpropionic acid transporter